MIEMKKKDIYYWARIIPETEVYEIPELVIRTIADTWFVGCDKRDKHAYMFNYDVIGKTVFKERDKALTMVKEAESKKIKRTEEIKENED